MIKKLRRKFILVIMSVVAVLIIAAFVGVLISTSSNLEQEGQFALNDALNKVNFPEPHGGKPGDRPMPIITISADKNGAVTSYNNQIYSFSNGDIQTITHLALSSGTKSGILNTYNLRFLIQISTDGTTTLAFIDNTQETRIIQNLLVNSAIIGVSTLVLFLGISILLSRWVLKPVEKAWNSQRQFIADASHELKTPLTVILSNSALLSDENLNADTRTKNRLANILAEAKRMKVLVDDLLSLARSDEAKGKRRHEKANFSNAVQNAVLRFEPIIYEKGKKFNYAVAEDLTVIGDNVKLRQIAEILLDNACKYATPGTCITLELKAANNKDVLLEVINASETIPKSELSKIFERFYRLDKSRSSSGYGLGLSIASAIVSEHTGKIWASSEDGRTAFCVTLPMAR